MTIYSLKDYNTYIYETVVEGVEEVNKEVMDQYLEKIFNPDLEDVLLHYLRECLEATKAGDLRPEWDDLQKEIELVQMALSGEKIVLNDGSEYARSVPMAFMDLGQAIANVKYTLQRAQTERRLATLELEKLKRDRGRERENYIKNFLKGVAQEKAKEVWGKYDHTHYTQSQIAALVFKWLIDKFEHDERVTKLIPDGETARKGWLEPVAPEYAKKRGRRQRRASKPEL